MNFARTKFQVERVPIFVFASGLKRGKLYKPALFCFLFVTMNGPNAQYLSEFIRDQHTLSAQSFLDIATE